MTRGRLGVALAQRGLQLTLRRACLLAACLVVITAIPVRADPEINMGLDPVSGTASRVRATILLPEDRAGPTLLVLQADGLSPLGQYTVWLHAGSVQQPSASAAFLGYLDANPGGQASLKTTSVEAGAMGSHLDLSPALLGDGQHLIEIRDAARAVVAVGQVPVIQPGADLGCCPEP